MSIYRMVRQTPNSPSKSDTTAAVGANSGDDNTTPSKQSVVTVDLIPQGPTINLIDPYVTEFRQPLQVQSHLEMPRILVQLGHTQRTQKLAPQTDPKWSPTWSLTRF